MCSSLRSNLMTETTPKNGAMFRSLRSYNARIFFIGIFVSHTGTWLQHTAVSYLLYDISQNATTLGINSAILFLPMLVFGVSAGSFADRVDRRRIVLFTQSGMAAQSLLLSALVLTDHINIPVVYCLSAILGFLNALDNPARRGFVTELVPANEILNAVSLNTAVMFTARVFGPALGALLIAPLGVGYLFFFNGVSFVAILVGLLKIRKNELIQRQLMARGGTPIRDALKFVGETKPLLTVMIVFALVSTFAFNYTVSLPKLADKVWGRQDIFGWILAAISVGSIFGALFTARLGKGVYRWFTANTILLGATNLGLAWAPTMWIGFFWAVPLGFAGASVLAGINAISQLESPVDMRSRLLALTAVAALGSTPIGGPITGFIADSVSVQWSLAYGGFISLALGAYMVLWMWRKGIDRG